jgi:hypothetical protein
VQTSDYGPVSTGPEVGGRTGGDRGRRALRLRREASQQRLAGAMPRRGAEGMGLMEGHAVGAGGGAATVIQRQCVWRRGGGEGGSR